MHGCLARLRSFWKNRHGGLAIWFVFATVPMIVGLGAAIDYSRAALLETRFQSALDTAALSAAKDVLVKSDSQLQTDAQTYLQAIMGNQGTVTITSFVVDQPRTHITITAATNYQTVFMTSKLLAALSHIGHGATMSGTDNIPMTATSQSVAALDTFEIALVVDNSSSMTIFQAGGGQSRLQATQTAVNNLIDIMYSQSSTATKTRMSIVPFGASVNVGPGFANAGWMDTGGNSSIHWQHFPDPATGGKPLNPHTQAGTTPPNTWPAASRFDLFAQLNVAWKGCVEARPGVLQVTDDPPVGGDSLFVPMFAPDEPSPDTNPAGTISVSPSNYNGSTYNNNYLSDVGGACVGMPNPNNDSTRQNRLCKYRINQAAGKVNAASPGPNWNCNTLPILRMVAQPGNMGQASATATTLKNQINAMNAPTQPPYNFTNLPEGFTWGWRTISPNAPFSDGRAYNFTDNRKIIIFMTDGINEWGWPSTETNPNKSIYFAQGYFTDNRIPNTTINTLQDARNALDSRTLAACTNAKAANVIVYTVGFDGQNGQFGIDAQGKQLLSDCASPDPTNTGKKLSWIAQSPGQLTQAFQDIALNIGKLRLSQ